MFKDPTLKCYKRFRKELLSSLIDVRWKYFLSLNLIIYKKINSSSIDWNFRQECKKILPTTLAWYPCGSLEIASSLSLEQSLPKLEPEALGLKPGTLGGVTFLAPWLKRWLRFMPPTENRKITVVNKKIKKNLQVKFTVYQGFIFNRFFYVNNISGPDGLSWKPNHAAKLSLFKSQTHMVGSR
jgi:hypothetical protein